MKCELHDFPLKTYCSWCSKPMCTVCVAESDGKKYCRGCFSKLKPHARQKFFKSGGTGVIQNVDPSLNEDAIKETREEMEDKYGD